MKFDRLHCVVAVLSLSAIGSAQALDYKSIGAAPAVLYDAPSARGKKVFVAPRNMPVEVILSYGEWTKVRDAAGDLSWVESRALTPKRHVLVKSGGVRIRASAEDGANTVFTTEKGVVLELLDPAASGWVKVRHRDGQSGFVKVGDVWGE